MKLLRCCAVIGLCLAVAGAGEAKFEASWASLDKRPTPEWFAQARFGILVVWGPYSVPAWAPKGHRAEQYGMRMLDKEGPTWQYHVKTFGEKLTYRQFAPMLKAEKFQPDQWADLFARAGARYVVLAAKTRDGYCLWPSAQAKGWNAMEAGPKRDLLGDLAKAVRKRGLKMGVRFSLPDHASPLYRANVADYVGKHLHPQFKDLVARCAPSILLADGGSEQADKTWKSEEFLAWLFNESPCGKEVAVNDRWGKGCRGVHGGCYTSEDGDRAAKVSASHIWQETQGIGRSFAYNRNEDLDGYRPAAELVRLLVECVSRGGSLLLAVGPAADGTIPQAMQDRLLEMGKWLKANGESIYGAAAGTPPKMPWGRTTAKPGYVFLHVYEWPKGDLEVPGLQARVVDAWMLADPGRSPLLLGRSEKGALTVTVPRKAPDPIDSVIVLKVEGEVRVAAPARPVLQAPKGGILLRARDAAVHGQNAKYEHGGGKDNIGFWNRVDDWVSWDFDVTKPGTFEVEIVFACARGSGGSEYVVAVGKQQLRGKVKETGSWARFTAAKLGKMTLAKPGRYTLSVKPTRKARTAVMNLQAVILRQVKK